MVKDMFCDSCKKNSVCKNLDILMKFDETAKKQLGIDITMDKCENFDEEKLTDD